MLVSEIMGRVRNILGDASGTRWPDSRIIGLIDEAQKDICRRSLLLRDSVNIILHDGQSSYTLPSDAYQLTRVTYDNKALGIKSTNSMDKLNPTWATDSGDPRFLVYDKLNKGVIKFSPIPSFVEPDIFVLADAPYVSVSYTKTPITLVASTDETEIPNDYIILIEFYVSGRLFREDFDTQNRTFGNEQLSLYSSGIKDLIKEISRDFLGASIAYESDYRVGV